jgi:hypothetical protein
MKTQSIKSIATLFGVALALNVSALAGPGPQLPAPTRKVSEPKKAAVTIALAGTARDSKKADTTSEPKLFQVSGPRGDTYTFRR